MSKFILTPVANTDFQLITMTEPVEVQNLHNALKSLSNGNYLIDNLIQNGNGIVRFISGKLLNGQLTGWNFHDYASLGSHNQKVVDQVWKENFDLLKTIKFSNTDQYQAKIANLKSKTR